MQAEKGFTIVELLIVIVVIAILATITIVAYNGVQNRAKTTSAQTSAATVRNKLEVYNSINGVYPGAIERAGGIAVVTNALNTIPESSLTGTGLSIRVTPTTSTGQKSVRYEWCGISTAEPANLGTGYRIRYYNYSSRSLSGIYTGGFCNGVYINSSS